MRENKNELKIQPIKTRNPTNAVFHVRSVYIKTKENVHSLSTDTSETPSNYASNRVVRSARVMGDKGIKHILRYKDKSIRNTAKNIVNIKQRVKAGKMSGKVVRQGTKSAIKTSQKAVQLSKNGIKGFIHGVKIGAKAVVSAAKAIITGTKLLIEAIVAGGWVAVCIIVIFVMVGYIAGSVYGMFLSEENTAMTAVVNQTIEEYRDYLDEICSASSYDELVIQDENLSIKEVIAVYVVKVWEDTENPQEILLMDSVKADLFQTIFWDMNEATAVTESLDEHTVLTITIINPSLEELTEKYDFDENQKNYLRELLNPKNDNLWETFMLYINI